MNIGLVLSGGMAKGAYQIGALKAINELLPKKDITHISCASVGVLNGYAYATDKLDCAEQLWKSICENNARVLISQMLRSSMLQSSMATLFDDSKALSSSFYASLLDIGRKSIVYKDLLSVENELIPLYLKASVAMPIYNRAVKISGFSYYDGAMVDNIPVYPLLQHELDYILCLYFDDTCYKFENTCFDNKIIKITFPCQNRLRQSLVFRKESIEEMITVGYERTRHLLKYVFSEGYDNKAKIYQAIGFLNQNKSTSLRITGDVLVTNLNKITQKLAIKRIL